MPIEISEAPSIAAPANLDAKRLAALIDHTLLKPESTNADVERVCREALEYGFACVMLNPANVPLASSVLSASNVKVGSVIGFPFGATTTSTKRYEALEAMKLGARELDMAINVGALKSGERARVEADIRGLVEVAHDNGALLKLTIEASLLSLEEKILACQLALAAGADFVKSNTGFASRGADAADISLMRGVAGHKMGVKAAGGIRTIEDVQSMIEAGANRIGTSASVAIIEAARGQMAP
jgi:deoxyribose-phosphate aldolase